MMQCINLGLKDPDAEIQRVVDGYKKVETGVVGAYEKAEDKFVDRFLTKDGESIAEAKERLKS